MGADGTDYEIEDIWPNSKNPIKWIIAFCREKEIHYHRARNEEYQHYGIQEGWKLSSRAICLFFALAFLVFVTLIVLTEGGVICHP